MFRVDSPFLSTQERKIHPGALRKLAEESLESRKKGGKVMTK